MRWSEAGYLSRIVLSHALRQVSVSLILDVRHDEPQTKRGLAVAPLYGNESVGRETMCTVIAKESATRVVVLSGLPCCLSVAEVTPSIPKVAEINGWFELFTGEITPDVPNWAAWLESDAKMKIMAERGLVCRGKRVFFFDVSTRWKPSSRSWNRALRASAHE
jgi:hypothetical protein